jgi:hypothetical protein
MRIHERNAAAGGRCPFERVFGQGRGLEDVAAPARSWRGYTVVCVETPAGPVRYVAPNDLLGIVENGNGDLRSLVELDRSIRRRFGGEDAAEFYAVHRFGVRPDLPNSKRVAHRTAVAKRKRGRRRA